MRTMRPISPGFIRYLLFAFVHFYSIQGASVPCSGISDTATGACYESHSDQQLSWQDASTACNNTGGQLAWITDDAEENILLRLLQSINQPVWLGGHLENLYSNQVLWRWSEDKTMLASQGCYHDNSANRDLSVQITSISSSSMTVDKCVTACANRTYQFAGLQAGTQCYCGNTFGQYGRMEQPKDAAVCDTKCSGNSSQYCGGPQLNSIYYVNGTYSQWGYARPNNYNGYQTCGILMSTVSYKMDDDDCGKPQYPFICDIPTSLCVNGSQTLNGACYYFSPSTTRTTWFLARMNCLARGGDLVKIASFEVWDTLQSIINTNGINYWIGMSATYWYWSNGLEVQYSNWYSSSVSSYAPYTRGNKCMLLDPNSDNHWVDSNCDQRNYYICVRGKILATSTTSTTKTPTTTTMTSTTTTTTPPTTTTTTTTTTTPTTTTTTTTRAPTTTKTTTTTTTKPQPPPTTTTTSTTTTTNTASTITAQSASYPYIPALPVDGAAADAQTTSSANSILPPVEIALIVICSVLAVVFIALLSAFLVHRRNIRLNKVSSNSGNNGKTNGVLYADFRSADKLQDNVPKTGSSRPHVISSPPRLAVHN